MANENSGLWIFSARVGDALLSCWVTKLEQRITITWNKLEGREAVCGMKWPDARHLDVFEAFVDSKHEVGGATLVWRFFISSENEIFKPFAECTTPSASQSHTASCLQNLAQSFFHICSLSPLSGAMFLNISCPLVRL